MNNDEYSSSFSSCIQSFIPCLNMKTQRILFPLTIANENILRKGPNTFARGCTHGSVSDRIMDGAAAAILEIESTSITDKVSAIILSSVALELEGACTSDGIVLVWKDEDGVTNASDTCTKKSAAKILWIIFILAIERETEDKYGREILALSIDLCGVLFQKVLY